MTEAKGQSNMLPSIGMHLGCFKCMLENSAVWTIGTGFGGKHTGITSQRYNKEYRGVEIWITMNICAAAGRKASKGNSHLLKSCEACDQYVGWRNVYFVYFQILNDNMIFQEMKEERKMLHVPHFLRELIQEIISLHMQFLNTLSIFFSFKFV